jgi:hypothetical protein
MLQCSLVEVGRSLRGAYCLRHQGETGLWGFTSVKVWIVIFWIATQYKNSLPPSSGHCMEPISSFLPSVTTYKYMRCRKPEDHRKNASGRRQVFIFWIYGRELTQILAYTLPCFSWYSSSCSYMINNNSSFWLVECYWNNLHFINLMALYVP